MQNRNHNHQSVFNRPELKDGKLRRTIFVGSAVLNLILWPYNAYTAMNEEQAIPTSVCDITITENRDIDLKNAAQECLIDRYGKVALVGYGVESMRDLEIAAAEAENTLAEATDWLIRPEIIPVTLSDEARQKFEDTNPECVGVDIKQSGGYIADKSMDLSEYGHVVSVAAKLGCNEEGRAEINGGNAPMDYGSRYVNVFGQNRMPERYAYTRLIEESHDMSDIIAHELGHSYGLGHADKLNNVSTGGYDLLQRTRIYLWKMGESYVQPEIIDVTPPNANLTKDEYLGYGGMNDLMGRHIGKLAPSDAQRWQLTWPERVLGKMPDHQIVINGGTKLIEKPTDKNHDFAVLKLDEQAVFTHWGYDNVLSTNTFDKLVFSQELDDPRRIGLSLATNDHVNTLDIGYITSGQDDARPKIVKIANQSIRVEYLPDQGWQFTDVTSKKYEK